MTVPYLGAAPEEVEEGVCVRVEESIQGLDGIKKVTSVASEGVGIVTVELLLEADSRKVLDETSSSDDDTGSRKKKKKPPPNTQPPGMRPTQWTTFSTGNVS